MDPDRLNPTDRPPIDDAALAALVRDVAGDWHLPPQRLDEVTWRDRVGRGHGSQAGGGGSGVRWTRRFFGAAAIAVVATISLSFAAVWLTAPRNDQGAVGPSGSPSPSHGAASSGPSVSAAPAASPLPKLVLNGDPVAPGKVMVRTAESFRVVDLATGTLGPESLQAAIGPATVLARPGGGWICICGTGMSPQAVQLSLVMVDPNGVPLNASGAGNGVMDGATRLKDLQGTYDPNESAALQPQIADVHVSATSDGRFALIGWIYRDGAAGWVTGVDVLDLASLEVTSTQELTLDEPIAIGGRGRVRAAPVASVSADGSTMLLTSFWYMDEPNNPTPVSGTDHWTGSISDGVFPANPSGSALVAAGSTASPACFEFDAGPMDKDSYYRLCRTPSGQFEVTRVRIDGTAVDTHEVSISLAEGALEATRTADALFIWDPRAHTMIRFDFATGMVTTGRGRTASVPDGVVDRLAAIGRHIGHVIVPSAVAKDILEPGIVAGIVASPDGRRIFALGIGGEDTGFGSTGVDAFDADTLAPLWHAEPTADFSSMAINADGTAVYVSAPGGIAPDGSGSPDNGASITVFDSARGEVRLLAGQIGQPGTHDLLFTEPVLR